MKNHSWLGLGRAWTWTSFRPGPQLAAIDLTPAMLAVLRRRVERLGLEVDARVMDGPAMDSADASFDLVILHLILAVSLNPVRCLREVARVLKPGGRVLIFDKFIPDAKRPLLIFRLLNPLLSFLGTELTRQLGPIMQGAGLTVEHEEPAGGGGLFKLVILKKSPMQAVEINEESPQ